MSAESEKPVALSALRFLAPRTVTSKTSQPAARASSGLSKMSCFLRSLRHRMFHSSDACVSSACMHRRKRNGMDVWYSGSMTSSITSLRRLSDDDDAGANMYDCNIGCCVRTKGCGVGTMDEIVMRRTGSPPLFLDTLPNSSNGTCSVVARVVTRRSMDTVADPTVKLSCVRVNVKLRTSAVGDARPFASSEARPSVSGNWIPNANAGFGDWTVSVKYVSCLSWWSRSTRIWHSTTSVCLRIDAIAPSKKLCGLGATFTL
ncbi:hypothetical protein H257_01480 [Aphanomyces astaci]|uniref:Uncharacterized protein n=1 Tax=Aphanomyces astaci TaxID=112090 RepID=W4HA68_APHAT|nr:hypothetical protein H257_01480 [Aphanomyces astaci]ETV88149.1 hypothetical protein H257_01480 [Aphanomyces astaci]|eukprot:XP_009823012.1 hypothetical protein H257_01480 [Aphanomyces astaci]